MKKKAIIISIKSTKLSSKETIEGVKIGKEIVETLFEDNKE